MNGGLDLRGSNRETPLVRKYHPTFCRHLLMVVRAVDDAFSHGAFSTRR